MAGRDIPRSPKGLGSAGRKLWRAILAEFELQAHEELLLEQAARCADLCVALQEQVDREGPIVTGRANPAAVELRLQRQQLGKLLVALRVPLGDQETDGRDQKRGGFRGHYGIRGVV